MPFAILRWIESSMSINNPALWIPVLMCHDQWTFLRVSKDPTQQTLMHYTRMQNFDWTMLSQDFTVEHCYTQQHMRGNPFQVCSFLVCICMRSISEAEQCPSRSFHYYSGVYKYFSAWTYQRIQCLLTLVHNDGMNFTSAVNTFSHLHFHPEMNSENCSAPVNW